MNKLTLCRAIRDGRLWKCIALGLVLIGATTPHAIPQVGLGGQISAAQYFKEKVVAQAGQIGEVAPEGMLPVDRYHEFKAVVLVEATSSLGELNERTSWNSPENQEKVRNYVQQGGTLVIIDNGFPLVREGSVTLADFSDLFGFANFDSVMQEGAALVRATDEGGNIFSDPAWKTGLEFPPWHTPRISFPSENGLFAKALLLGEAAVEDGGKEPILGTVHTVGRGKVYWFRWSPMRLSSSVRNGLVEPKVADIYEQSLANIFTEK